MFVAFLGRLRLWLAIVAFAAVTAPQTAAAADFDFNVAAGNFIQHSFGCGNCNGETITWTTSVPLPPGVSLQPNPTNGPAFVYVQGVPTAVGSTSLSLIGTRPNSNTVTLTIDFNISAPNVALAPASGSQLPTGRKNVPGYGLEFTASGGNGPYTYSVFSGALPPGLLLNQVTGEVTGIPTLAGTHNFTIRATDTTTGPGAPYGVTQAYQITIFDTVAITTTSPLPNAEIGAPYSQQLTASGGDGGPYTFTGTNVPAGLSLSSTGLLSGTPTEAGPFVFSAQAVDQGGYNGAKVFQLGVAPPTIDIQPATLNNATVGVAYNQTLAAAGGTAPYQYGVTAGALPAGVTLNPTTGALSGTPTAGGTFNFTVAAVDSSTGVNAPFSAFRSYTWTVQGPAMTISPAAGALPAGQQAVAYSQTFTASGGITPHTYTVFSGSLPPGVTLNPSTGVLSGTPTGFGAFSFTIRATDSATGTGPFSVDQAYTLNIQQAVPTISSVAPTSGTTAGGQTVTIFGTNFQNVTGVTFGGAAASFSPVNATTVTVTTPAHAAGPVDVVVTTPGGAATLTNAYTYIAPGAVRFVINSGDDNGSFAFTSATPGLNFTVTTSGGTGTSPTVTLQPGNYAAAFTVPDGFGLNAASCSPSTSTVNTSAHTAALVVASNVTTVCTIEALGSRRAAVEMLGTALDASSRLIIANAPSLSRRIDRLNGGGASDGAASAFGKTFASGLPFSADIGADQVRFAMSLSGLRKQGDADHRFNAVNDNGVPASLAASAAPASGLAATAAGDAAAAMTARSGPRFDVWVEGLLATFDAAANSEGSFAIVHAGADYLVSDNVLVGIGLQGDWLDMDTATGNLDSSGWLVGPYFTARLADGLYLDARAAWGGANFDVSPFGTYTDKVSSDRALYSAALIGSFEMGNLTIRPEGRVTWYKETTEAYIDSLSVAIPEVEIKTGEVSLGPDFEWTLKQQNGGVFMPKIGFDLVWTFQQDNTATQFTGAPGLDETGMRGRVEGGLAYIDPRGVEFGGSLFYDGIGGGDYSAWGGSLKLRFGF
ncbi:MAG: putative Ig domain-containing protein [Micropepsaceae bacterium]